MTRSWAADRVAANSHAPTANAAAAAAANPRASRSWIDTSRHLGRGKQAVAHAADGLDVVPPERGVDLPPQVVHVLVDNVRTAVIGEVPHRLDDLRPGEDVAGVPQK